MFVSLLFSLIFLPTLTRSKIKKHSSTNAYLELIDAKALRSVSGLRGGGSSTEYFFRIKILSDKKTTFDSIWLNHNSFKTYLANNKKISSNAPISFGKNDTVTVRVSDTKGNSKLTEVAAPISCQDEAILRYYVNEKSFYLSIKNIKLIIGPNRP